MDSCSEMNRKLKSDSFSPFREETSGGQWVFVTSLVQELNEGGGITIHSIDSGRTGKLFLTAYLMRTW